jgi:vacuolar-type H+-ATPase subunit F/Vma7
MGEVAAIGAAYRVEGFGLAGVRVRPAEEPADVRAAWQDLPATVAVVVLTRDAAAALGDLREAPGAPLAVVMP